MTEKPLTDRQRVWAMGAALLGNAGRSFLGSLCGTYGEPLVAEVLAEATIDPPAEPKAWLTAACATRAKAKPARNGYHVESPLDGDAKPAWAINAGFPDRFQAENAGCKAGNFRKFRNGQRIDA